jgi:hypothetical protein
VTISTDAIETVFGENPAGIVEEFHIPNIVAFRSICLLADVFVGIWYN